MPWAASPPSTFCQDQVTTSSLSQGSVHGEDGRGGVADGEPLAVGRDPVAVGHAHARGGAVPGEDDVAVAVGLASDRAARHSRPRSVRTSLSFSCCTTSPTQPLPKALPGQHVDAARRRAATRAPSRPRRYRRPARCRAGSRPACFSMPAAALDHLGELGLALLRAVRAAEHGLLQRRQRPARPLGAGAGGKAGIARAGGGFHCRKQSFTVATSTKSAASYGLCCGASTKCVPNLPTTPTIAA